jgi:CRISP-associated protein Cas1
VRAKLENSRLALRRAGRHRPADVSASDQLLRDLARRADGMDSLEALNGLEGAGAAEYFAAWARLLPDGWSFPGRPPPDPVNAMLSYGYSILYWNLYARCEPAACTRTGAPTTRRGPGTRRWCRT